MGLDHPVDRHHCVASSPDLVGQRRHAERDTFTGKARPGGGVADAGRTCRTSAWRGSWGRPSARGDVERCGWLRDLLTVPVSAGRNFRKCAG
jgi:hypothetical protein